MYDDKTGEVQRLSDDRMLITHIKQPDVKVSLTVQCYLEYYTYV